MKGIKSLSSTGNACSVICMIFNCDQCKKRFVSYNKSAKFCSVACKASSQTACINSTEAIRLYKSGHSQEEVAKALGTSQKVIFNTLRRARIKARPAIKREQFGNRNHAWKGDRASRYAFHRRLYTRYGKPFKCSVCRTTQAKHYDYASLNGRYEDLTDYAPMCRSCHSKYDKKILNITTKRRRRDAK